MYHNRSPHDKKHIDYKHFSRQVDGIISPSKTGLDLCVENYPHLGVVPRAVSRIGRYSAQPAIKSKKIDMPERRHKLLSFGYIRPYKGLEALIGAIVNTDRDDVLLIVCGQAIDPGYTQNLIKMAANSEKIQFDIGFISDEKLQQYFSQCTAAVFAFGNLLHSSSVVAARSAGLPVLAPAVGSLEEYAELDPGLHTCASPVTSSSISEFLDVLIAPTPDLPDEHFGWASIGRNTASLITKI